MAVPLLTLELSDTTAKLYMSTAPGGVALDHVATWSRTRRVELAQESQTACSLFFPEVADLADMMFLPYSLGGVGIVVARAGDLTAVLASWPDDDEEAERTCRRFNDAMLAYSKAVGDHEQAWTRVLRRIASTVVHVDRRRETFELAKELRAQHETPFEAIWSLRGDSEPARHLVAAVLGRKTVEEVRS